MKASDFFEVGNKYQNEGRMDLAIEMFKEAIKLDPNFGPGYVNLYNIYRGQNNLPMAKQALIQFLNCPVTGVTLDLIPKVKADLAGINEQLNPKPK